MRGLLQEEWSIDIPETITAPPTVSSNIYVGSQSGTLYAFTKEGKTIWSCTTQPKSDSFFVDSDKAYSISTKPIITPQGIVISNEQGIVFCISEKGSILWQYQTDSSVITTPNIIKYKNDTLIAIGSHDKHIHLLHMDGTVCKKILFEEKIHTAIQWDGSAFYFGTSSGSIFSCNSTGKTLWEHSLNSNSASDILLTTMLTGERILLFAADTTIYAISVDGELLWKQQLQEEILSKPVVFQSDSTSKEILLGSADNSVYCMDLETGQTQWSYETDFWVKASPTVYKNKKYSYAIVGSFDTNIYVLDTKANYGLDSIPGLGGVVNQGTFHNTSIGGDYGNDNAKSLYCFSANGFIVGCETSEKNVFSATNKGRIYNFTIR